MVCCPHTEGETKAQRGWTTCLVSHAAPGPPDCRSLCPAIAPSPYWAQSGLGTGLLIDWWGKNLMIWLLFSKNRAKMDIFVQVIYWGCSWGKKSEDRAGGGEVRVWSLLKTSFSLVPWTSGPSIQHRARPHLRPEGCSMRTSQCCALNSASPKSYVEAPHPMKWYLEMGLWDEGFHDGITK